MVHLTGASNIYFIRYVLYNQGKNIHSFRSTLYFSNSWVLPISFRLFNALNMLSHHIKKSMYHIPEAYEPRKSFRLYFLSEAFLYLYSRIADHSAVKQSIKRCQRIVKYYDTLKMESITKENDEVYLQIITTTAMTCLHQILGIGVGIGCGSDKPTRPCTDGVTSALWRFRRTHVYSR
jgi:hypothetical protein